MIRIALTLVVGIFFITKGLAQTTGGGFLAGQDTTRRVITTAVPFVSFAPDSRASGMGDVGVATSPDANSVHWNNAKLAFIDQEVGFAFSYSPWLGNIVDDMFLTYLSGFYQIDEVQTVGMSLRYFDLGEIFLTRASGDPNNPVENLGVENPRELAIDATYSRKLTENLGIGVTGRFIWSNLAGNITGDQGAKNGTSVAVDLGVYYNNEVYLGANPSDLSFGLHLSNIGQKITYSSESNEDFIPGNFRIGTALKTDLDPFNTLTFAFDINKLMVPSPQIDGSDRDKSLLSGTFGSFADAEDGFSEELKELMFSIGVEYWYRDLVSARTGFFSEHDDKGDRQYFTAGLGFRYQVFGLDFSYLLPTETNHPLAETLRLTLLFNFEKKDNE